MEWLTQNWIWIVAALGAIAVFGFSRSAQGGSGSLGNGDSQAGGGHGGCCGGHDKQPFPDKPGTAHGHQH